MSASEERPEAAILRYCEERLAAHGDTAAGAGWPNERDRVKRFDVLLDLVEMMCPRAGGVLCDLGCGTGELLRRLRERKLERISYVGVDVSAAALGFARRKFPGVPFHRIDVSTAAEANLRALESDVIVANGLFTLKDRMSHAEMWTFMTRAVERIWPLARRGIAFNVMSKAVDWEREDLFHVSYDDLARFLHRLAGRAIGFRADYGLYEYTAYALKSPYQGRR